MTKHADKIAALKADEEGKVIHYREKPDGYWYSSGKGNTSNLKWDFSTFDYRTEPETKYRPWKYEEVLVGASTRCIATKGDLLLIVGSRPGFAILGTDPLGYPLDTLFIQRECSIDLGKTWSPCGVKEEV